MLLNLFFSVKRLKFFFVATGLPDFCSMSFRVRPATLPPSLASRLNGLNPSEFRSRWSLVVVASPSIVRISSISSNMIAQVFAVESFEFFVTIRCHIKSALQNFIGEYGIFNIFFGAPIFPFVGQSFPHFNFPHPFFNPRFGISFCSVYRPRPLRGQLRIFNFLYSLIADFRQPAFERLGFGRGNGLDNTKDAFGAGAIKPLRAALSWDRKGGWQIAPTLWPDPDLSFSYL